MLSFSRVAGTVGVICSIVLGSTGVATAQPDECPALSLASDTVSPYTQLGTFGLPSRMDGQILAAFIDTETGEAVVTPYIAPSGVMVPPHPVTPFEGGNAELVLTDSDVLCAPREVSIAPLPDSAGATRKMLSNLQDSLENTAALLGVDVNDLQDPDFKGDNELEDWLAVYGRWLAWDGQDSLMARLQALEASDDEAGLKLLDAVVAKAGFVTESGDFANRTEKAAAAQREKFGYLNLLAPPVRFTADDRSPATRLAVATPGVATGTSGVSASTAMLMMQSTPSSAPVTINGEAFGEALKPRNAAELSDMMNTQFDSEISGKPEVGKYRDMAGLVLGSGGAAIKTASGGTPIGAIGDGYIVLSEALFVQAQLEKVWAGLYPAEFGEMEIDYGPVNLRLRDGEDMGSVRAINVTLQARGMELSKIAADIALTKLPIGDALSRSARPYAQKLAGSSAMAGAGTVALNSAQVNAVAGKMVRNQQVVEATANTVDGIAKTGTSFYGINNMPDLVTIEPFDYPPVNIMTSGFYTLTVDDPSVVSLGLLSQGSVPYTGIKEGSVSLTAMSNPGRFANSAISASVPIFVGEDETSISISPDRTVAIPGDEVRFSVLVYDEDGDVDIDITLSPARHSYRLREINRTDNLPGGAASAVYDLVVETVDDKDAFPVTAMARMSAKPDQVASATIERARIEPVACVPWGVAHQFRTNVPEALASIEWQVSGIGSVERDGTYTAQGSGPKKRSRITAIDADTGEELDSLYFDVGCTCSWTYSVAGQTSSGTIAHIRTFSEGGEPAYVIDMTQDDSDGTEIFSTVQMMGRGRPFDGVAEPFEFGCRNGIATNDVTGSVQAIRTRDGVSYISGADLPCPRRQTQAERVEGGHCPDVPGPSITLTPLAGGEMVRGRVTGQSTEFDGGALECRISQSFMLSFTAARSPMDMSGMEELARQAEADPSSIDPMAMMQQMMKMTSGGDMCAPDDY
ncbi:hypothetical protein FF098_012360 [Parvularcula flava]|uniref:Uncharacterized protein n=1 Tax=Aquisalinus luteolus TaxID=1566827 RepID=A0A8J3ERL1_9PROT|nr:hypothetical protein [Aquisalinus luteolus]NHK28704.1 hypothetical protein [Aquisalinus luteolus]GGH99266.1 hypothetical protein GCM10011355_24820 [Aquisalinus luteolus]